MNDRMSIKMAGFALAMNAKVNDVDQLAVEDLHMQASQLLESDDPLFRAISEFATQYELIRFDSPALAAQGAQLSDAIERLNVPEPPDMNRTDIYG